MIRALGMELAQTRVDNAFLAGRLDMVRSILAGVLFTSVVDDQMAPGGYAFIPTAAIAQLQAALGTTT